MSDASLKRSGQGSSCTKSWNTPNTTMRPPGATAAAASSSVSAWPPTVSTTSGNDVVLGAAPRIDAGSRVAEAPSSRADARLVRMPRGDRDVGRSPQPRHRDGENPDRSGAEHEQRLARVEATEPQPVDADRDRFGERRDPSGRARRERRRAGAPAPPLARRNLPDGAARSARTRGSGCRSPRRTARIARKKGAARPSRDRRSRQPATPSPTASMTPTSSWPSVMPARTRSGSEWKMWRSEPHRPQASTRRRTSPAPGSGIATVSARTWPRPR